MSDENEEETRTKLVQRLTCPCCSLSWKTEQLLVIHLKAIRNAITGRLKKLGVEP